MNNEELMLTACDSEIIEARILENFAPEGYEELLKFADYFIERTNCIIEKTK